MTLVHTSFLNALFWSLFVAFLSFFHDFMREHTGVLHSHTEQYEINAVYGRNRCHRLYKFISDYTSFGTSVCESWDVGAKLFLADVDALW